MKLSLKILMVVLITPPLLASDTVIREGSIIYASRKLRMSSTEPLPEKDYYIDLGDKQGYKKGDIFEVFRIQPAINGVAGDASNFIKIPIGEIKLILVGEYSSIGRLLALTDPKEAPILDYPAVMIGDLVRAKSNLPFDTQTP